MFRLTLLGNAFGTLDNLIEQKSAESPIFLKVLIGCMLEIMAIRGRKDRITEEFYLTNFSDLYARNADIPVTAMVDPLSKVLSERIKG